MSQATKSGGLATFLASAKGKAIMKAVRPASTRRRASSSGTRISVRPKTRFTRPTHVKVSVSKRPQSSHQRTTSRKAEVFKQRAVGVSRALEGATRGEGSSKTILYNMICPHSQENFRWPFNGGEPECAMTGTSALHNIFTVNAPNGFVGTYTGGSTTAWVAYLFRNALRNAVVLSRTSATFTYNATFYVAASGTNSTTWHVPAPGDVEPLPLVYMSCATAGAPHGPPVSGTSYLYTGALRDYPMAFVWMGPLDVFNFSATGGTGTDVITVTYLANPGSTDPQLADLATTYSVTSAATTSFPSSGSITAGYYAFTVKGATTTPWTYSCNLVVAAGDVLCHYSIPSAISHISLLSSARVTATSLLVSNVASELYREGPLYAALITDETDFRKLSTAPDITTRPTFKTGSNKLGIYGWLPPIGANAMLRRSIISSQGAVVTGTSFYLDDGVGYEVFRIDSTATGGSAAPALDFVATLQTAVEYVTTDPWVELEYSAIDVVDAQRALQVCTRCEPFADNPLHMSDIMSFIGRAASYIRKRSGYIGSVLATAFPAFATPITAVSSALQT